MPVILDNASELIVFSVLGNLDVGSFPSAAKWEEGDSFGSNVIDTKDLMVMGVFYRAILQLLERVFGHELNVMSFGHPYSFATAALSEAPKYSNAYEYAWQNEDPRKSQFEV